MRRGRKERDDVDWSDRLTCRKRGMEGFGDGWGIRVESWNNWFQPCGRYLEVRSRNSQCQQKEKV